MPQTEESDPEGKEQTEESLNNVGLSLREKEEVTLMNEEGDLEEKKPEEQCKGS